MKRGSPLPPSKELYLRTQQIEAQAREIEALQAAVASLEARAKVAVQD